MDIIKKNIWSVICAVIVLIALIVPFWPMGGYEAELQDDLATKKRAFTDLESLERKSRMMPTLNPGDKEATPLRQFPSPRIIEAGKTATEAVSQESQKIYQLAVSINQSGHDLLVPRCLPKPRSPEQIAFRDQYLRAFHDRLTLGLLKGTTPPTQEEIKLESDRLWNQDYQSRIFTTPGGQSNQESVKALFDEAVAKLPDAMRRQRASQSKVYVDTSAFDISKQITEAGAAAPEPRFIWWAQVTYWVQEDIARAIAETNTQANNVMDAPVKRLVRIDVPHRFVRLVTNPQGGPAGRSMMDEGYNPYNTGSPEGQVTSTAQPQDVDAPLPHDYDLSATGRISNPMFDVIHATVTVDIDAENIPKFMAALTNGRFHTILQANIAPVDSTLLYNDGYYFGNHPVVQLTIKLEALLMRDWTVRYMPDSVKTLLGIPL